MRRLYSFSLEHLPHGLMETLWLACVHLFFCVENEKSSAAVFSFGAQGEWSVVCLLPVSSELQLTRLHNVDFCPS